MLRIFGNRPSLKCHRPYSKKCLLSIFLQNTIVGETMGKQFAVACIYIYLNL